MAKRGTLEHPKTKRLARILGVCPGVAMGMLETIWHWVGDYRKDGAVTMVDLEDALDSGGWLTMFSAEMVAAAMTNVERECIWLDVLPDGRLYIHDWHVHSDDAVNRALARAKRYFANGLRPDLTRLGKDEREAIRAHFDAMESFNPSTPEALSMDSNARDAQDVRTSGALPEPEPEPEPEPVPVPEPSRDSSLRSESCPAAPEKSEIVVADPPEQSANWLDAACRAVTEHLNRVCGKSYDPKRPHKNLRARLRGFKVPDRDVGLRVCRLVIEHKHAEWGKDAGMRGYLRPETLFAEGHWQSYTQAAIEWDEAGRPSLDRRAGKSSGKQTPEDILAMAGGAA